MEDAPKEGGKLARMVVALFLGFVYASYFRCFYHLGHPIILAVQNAIGISEHLRYRPFVHPSIFAVLAIGHATKTNFSQAEETQ